MRTGTTKASVMARIESAIEEHGIAVVARDSTGRLKVAAGRCIECGDDLSSRYAARCAKHARAEAVSRKRRAGFSRGRVR